LPADTDRPPADRLVIFDCDGVLVDSEPISCRVYADMLTRHGYPITADAVRDRFLGRSVRDADREVERERGRALPEDFHSQLKIELLEALARDVAAVPHIHEAIDAIASPICVASSGGHDKIFATLSRTGLYRRFAPNIFSASQVANGKPAPDLFLYAARQMACRPEHCVVVEDSEAGVIAATASGMRVIGFVGGSHCREGDGVRLRAAGAGQIVADMRQLPGLLERYFAGQALQTCRIEAPPA
jgi:HAD superfamily hydrolase (TIGR01509 family)